MLSRIGQEIYLRGWTIPEAEKHFGFIEDRDIEDFLDAAWEEMDDEGTESDESTESAADGEYTEDDCFRGK